MFKITFRRLRRAAANSFPLSCSTPSANSAWAEFAFSVRKGGHRGSDSPQLLDRSGRLRLRGRAVLLIAVLPGPAAAPVAVAYLADEKIERLGRAVAVIFRCLELVAEHQVGQPREPAGQHVLRVERGGPLQVGQTLPHLFGDDMGRPAGRVEVGVIGIGLDGLAESLDRLFWMKRPQQVQPLEESEHPLGKARGRLQVVDRARHTQSRGLIGGAHDGNCRLDIGRGRLGLGERHGFHRGPRCLIRRCLIRRRGDRVGDGQNGGQRDIHGGRRRLACKRAARGDGIGPAMGGDKPAQSHENETEQKSRRAGNHDDRQLHPTRLQSVQPFFCLHKGRPRKDELGRRFPFQIGGLVG